MAQAILIAAAEQRRRRRRRRLHPRLPYHTLKHACMHAYAGLCLQEALAILQPYCDPSRPADISAAARAYYLAAGRSRPGGNGYHRQVANQAPFSLVVCPRALWDARKLVPSLRWLATVHVQRLDVGIPSSSHRLVHLEALARLLPPSACAGVQQLVVAADRLGQTFDAGAPCVKGMQLTGKNREESLIDRSWSAPPRTLGNNTIQLRCSLSAMLWQSAAILASATMPPCNFYSLTH